MALIVNLRHYLGDDLSLIKIPAPAAALREFLGCVAEAVTSRDPDDENYVTQLKCRNGSDGCDGDIIAFFDPKNSSVTACYFDYIALKKITAGLNPTVQINKNLRSSHWHFLNYWSFLHCL